MSNLDIIKKGYQAYADGDLETFMDLLDDDIAWSSQFLPGIPIHGTFRGIVGVVEFFTIVAETLEMQEMVPTQFFDGGDKVVTTGTSRSVLHANGKVVENSWVHVYTLKDGKITSYTSFNNVSAMAEAYGIAFGLKAANDYANSK